ncbi:MAG: hypothetical protein OXG82_00720 [Gammaproteobacteria bacterium]|nr:hypothetical protein [Gammaproteobacteria bacterium]
MSVDVLTVHLALWAVVAVQGLTIAFLFYRYSQLHALATQPSVGQGRRSPGAEIPSFEATNGATGEIVSSNDLIGARHFILAVEADCADCRELIRQIAEGEADRARFPHMLVYCQGSPRGCARVKDRLEPDSSPFWVQREQDVAELLGIQAFPALVEVDPAMHLVGYSYPTTRRHLNSIMGSVSEARSTE